MVVNGLVNSSYSIRYVFEVCSSIGLLVIGLFAWHPGFLDLQVPDLSISKNVIQV